MARLLIVDDEPNLRRLLADTFKEQQHEVTTACNGEEALACFEKGKFDLICLDIRMPTLDGIEVLSEIRNRDLNVPIVILTAYSDFKQDFSIWSADAYLEKTADLSELCKKVDELLARVS